MRITFIGNCQLMALCFYLQQLPYRNASWICFNDELYKAIWHPPQPGLFMKTKHWTDKCKNKIYGIRNAIQEIRTSDIIIYQEVSTDKSYFCNTAKIREFCKTSCRLIKLPCIYLEYHDYDNSIKELQKRELENNVDIRVSDIFEHYRESNLMLSRNHPNTFMFMQVMMRLCAVLGFPFLPAHKVNIYLQNINYMGLPPS